MSTDLMQHKKSVLFLISLSQIKIQEIEEKGVNYELFLKTIHGYSHVEVHETISEELISKAFSYNVVVVVGHQVNGCIEMADGSLFPMSKIAQALPAQFNGYMHVAVCGSTSIRDEIKQLCPDSRVRTSNKVTQLELQILIYSMLLSRTDLSKETFDHWYVFERDHIKELQKRKNPADLAKLPCATKLGDSSNTSDDSVKTSVFMPEKVTRGEFFKLQIKMHLDIDTGTLYLEDAEGNDPNTVQRKKNVAIKNIQIGDELLLNLCFLDGDSDLIPTEQIKIKKELYKEELNSIDNIYTLGITISEENQTLVLHVKIANEYIYSKFFTIIEFVKDSKPLIEPFNLETGFKTDDSQKCSNIKRSRGDIGGNQNKLVREPERVHLSIEQMKQLEEERRERILSQLLAYVNSGNWKRDEIASKVEHMLLTILGKGEKLNDKESKMSEQLWKCLENVRIGKDNEIGRVGVVWQNIIGYLDDKGLFKPTNSPALNKDFFNTKKGYPNIDKGRPSRGHLSYWFKDIIELLNKYCPQIE